MRWAGQAERRERLHTCKKFLSKNSIGRDHSDDQGVTMDWIHLAQDRDQWQVLVNTVMNLRVP